MKRSIEFSQNRKTCSLCNKSTEAKGISLIYFGEWMVKKEVTVHYYCLLLSTHLPQRGEDHSGILGFLLRDIRHEINMAKKRKCKYCFEMSASIQCCICKKYFHLTCGHTSKCLSQFVGEFKSYCNACLPEDKFIMDLFAHKPPQITELCFICAQIMGTNPKGWIYAKCCGNGFTHAKCMKIYALSAGYYLACIWCKDKRFREDIKYQGVFVPDREANWEKEKGAYGELYQGHKRCDMEVCNCPKGRNYINAFKWQLIICKFCGAFGAHNPSCIPDLEGTKEKILEFKCDVCSVTEQTMLCHKSSPLHAQDLIDTSLYVIKDTTAESESQEAAVPHSQILNINNSSCDSAASQETVINVKISKRNTLPAILDNTKSANDVGSYQRASGIYTLTQNPQVNQNHELAENDMDLDLPAKLYNTKSANDVGSSQIASGIYTLTQSPPISQNHAIAENTMDLDLPADLYNTKSANDVGSSQIASGIYTITQTPQISQNHEIVENGMDDLGRQENSDSDDSIIVNLLVQKMLDIFEVGD